jgi:hypothetical protein
MEPIVYEMILLGASLAFTALLIQEIVDNYIDKLHKDKDKRLFSYSLKQWSDMPKEQKETSLKWDIIALSVLTIFSWIFFFYLLTY